VPTPVPLLARRLTAGAALVALPLAAVVGCGTSAAAKKDSVQTSLQKASDNLRASGSTSVVLRMDDGQGKLKALATSGTDPASPQEADLLLGGTVSFTVDPANGKTMGDVQNADPALPPLERLKLANISMTVQADGGDLAQIRLVNGDVYAQVGVDKINDIVKTTGSTTDIGAQLDEAASGSSPLAPLVADVRAGKWLKLPLAPYAGQLQTLQDQAGGPSAQANQQKLGMDLLNAVRPFVAVTDAASSGDDRVLDVKVQAKQALKAALDTVKTMSSTVPGLASLDTSGIDKLNEGTFDGQVTLTDDHLKKITLDLQSAVRLAPPGATPAPDITGSTVAIDVDDAADEVSVPQDVSGVDVGKLVQDLVPNLSGLAGRGSGTSLPS
jgi:hypothetical protein